MTTRSPLLMALAALVLTACAMAMGGPGPARGGPNIPPVIGTATPLPFACALVARQQGGNLALEGRIDARDAVSGTYDLTVRGPGVSIDQSGDLLIPAGASDVLGQASVPGRLADLETAMTITTRGRTVTCPVQQG
ncbi:hypothetical protein FHG66_04320 [Rubellimicrobium rubrum]|uniref:CsgH-like domain-containing protein n=1 Tax=Rubellimicrobium rubrum TaxID=2585369 RepID=A0A5C4N589_9RHOB|nr:curli-like amyloid fiber formation chaperone CsgH [Rubellimicrobium rubrum]TNC52030.1 hypothetical protein FHG66_04320 [Rubellimicrobium rubrum]